MMKVVFDTNVILNAVMERPGSDGAQALIQAVLSEKIIGIVTANTITDIHYIVKKRIGEEAARVAVYNTLSIFDIAPVDSETCMAALSLPIKDYEDAVLAVCAQREEADCIATEDVGFMDDPGNLVNTLPPSKILELL